MNSSWYRWIYRWKCRTRYFSREIEPLWNFEIFQSVYTMKCWIALYSNTEVTGSEWKDNNYVFWSDKLFVDFRFFGLRRTGYVDPQVRWRTRLFLGWVRSTAQVLGSASCLPFFVDQRDLTATVDLRHRLPERCDLHGRSNNERPGGLRDRFIAGNGHPVDCCRVRLYVDRQVRGLERKLTVYFGIVEVLIAAMNCFSVNLAINVQNVFTVAKLGAILVIIGCGIYQIITGNTQYLESGFEGSVTNFGAIATAFYGGLYSYDGWYRSRASFILSQNCFCNYRWLLVIVEELLKCLKRELKNF